MNTKKLEQTLLLMQQLFKEGKQVPILLFEYKPVVDPQIRAVNERDLQVLMEAYYCLCHHQLRLLFDRLGGVVFKINKLSTHSPLIKIERVKGIIYKEEVQSPPSPSVFVPFKLYFF